MQEGSGDHTKKHKIWAERLMREPIFFISLRLRKSVRFSPSRGEIKRESGASPEQYPLL